MTRTLAIVFAAGLLAAAAGACVADEPGQASPARESAKADVVYVPTPHDVVMKMLDLGRVGRHDVVYDLGCGDGRIVVLAAKSRGARGVGYDIDPQRIRECHDNAKRYHVEDLVKFEQQDIFKLDLSGASVVTLYLLPSLNVRLIPQLEKLTPGSRIVSHDFDMKGIKPDKVVTFTSKEDNVRHTLYLWTTPLVREKADSP